MKKAFLSVVLMLGAIAAMAQTPQMDYIRKWAPTAVKEMYRSGVPASITLAQGLLESRYGLSPLAAEGNNHFGIKCHNNWTGDTMSYDDDEKGECFRKYPSAEDSFSDHSDFLRYRDRYKFLFDFKTSDYKAWAYGLKKAGYATDPQYPQKLIKNIEDYKLYEYDKMTISDFENFEELAEEEVVAEKPADTGKEKVETPKEARETVASEKKADQTKAESKVERKSERKAERKAEKKSEKTAKTSRSQRRSAGTKASRRLFNKKSEEEGVKDTGKVTREYEEVPAQIPASPLSLEEPKKVDKSKYEEFHFSLSREMYSRNGVPYITSIEGETYSSIAESNGLFLRELLRYNDLESDTELLPGTIVYLQPKKNHSEKGLDKYIVDSDSENLRDICQRFGVKMSSVIKMNSLPDKYVPREGDEIILRGKNDTDDK